MYMEGGWIKGVLYSWVKYSVLHGLLKVGHSCEASLWGYDLEGNFLALFLIPSFSLSFWDPTM